MGHLPTVVSTSYVNYALEVGVWTAPFVILLSLVVNYLECGSLEEFLRKHLYSLVVFVPLIISWGDVQFCYWFSSAHLLSSFLTFSIFKFRSTEKISSKNTFTDRDWMQKGFRLRAPQFVTLSFLGMIALGTSLLMIPGVSTEGKVVPFIDALFMATSATCVTGLSTLSLSDNFGLFGQIVILLLIQIGGLGIMTLSSSMTILLGKSMAMKDRIIMQDLLDISGLEDLMAMIIDIVKYTFLIELWGGILLTIGFKAEGFEFGQAIYYGFYHSISAFCNAGFSLFNSSLESYSTNPLIHGTIAVLVTLGGLGFIVLRELKEVIIQGKSFVRITLHTRIVLVTTFILTVGGALFIFIGEFLGVLDNYSIWEKIQISFFQSVTLRTAGFNTIPLNNLSAYTLYTMTLLMFIGASPGSTGGGIKTTSLAILIQSIMSTLKGQKQVAIFDRRIPSPMVVRTTALTFISIIIVSIFILLLIKLEPEQSFLTLYFEVISAFGTVGLSLGITPYLTAMGKFALSALMLIGRIGPLTLILAIGQQHTSTGKVDYPDGRVMIG
ncbi:MAG: hypothetical protein ISR65_01300 [Bacteriovoracaceae bacterium]|nr:hypothetical protein [Bacteriovoracaceae bacterium]